MNVDMSKVKKSPVPKDATDVVSYFRGDGIKILVLASGGMQVRDTNDSVLAHRAGSYADTPTSEIKKLAAAMLNRAERREVTHSEAAPQGTPDFLGDPIPVRTRAARPAVSHPNFRKAFDFLTSGRQFA